MGLDLSGNGSSETMYDLFIALNSPAVLRNNVISIFKIQSKNPKLKRTSRIWILSVRIPL